MFRLILLILFVAAMVVAGLAILTVLLALVGLVSTVGENRMQGSFQRIAYIALVILLIGLSTGWLGGI